MSSFDLPDFDGFGLEDCDFWHPASRFQQQNHWLRHRYAVERLRRPDGYDRAVFDFGATCGPIAFAAITGQNADAALVYFPELQFRPWTTRTDMQRALSQAGHRYTRQHEMWPVAGLCMVQFTGPWTERAFAQAALKHTHWIAVLGEYVFDINWGGWLPRENWEDVVLDELIMSRPASNGWRVLTGYELSSEAIGFHECTTASLGG